MALVARDLGYTYSAGAEYRVEALRGVGLTLERGDLLVIAGATGSGKSTLLRLMAGLLEPGTGTVEVDGDSPRTRVARGRVAIVFQNPESQFFAETLIADVAFGPRNLGAHGAEHLAASALDAVGLDSGAYGQRSPFTLSGGEARRAAIAGALAMRAPYLLLDEPTAGLDARGRRDVLAAIEGERSRAGVAVVTHDPEEFLGTATRILALDSGRPGFDGTVCEFTDRPEGYVRAGLRLPDVVRAQVLARDQGASIERVEIEPLAAAHVLAGAWRAGR
ncbi:MAG: ATP-binding cassette domain-containing protein [Coriobacteriia bacterium]|jgi:energy-coupling factor transport system ATP-binding protein